MIILVKKRRMLKLSKIVKSIYFQVNMYTYIYIYNVNVYYIYYTFKYILYVAYLYI